MPYRLHRQNRRTRPHRQSRRRQVLLGVAGGVLLIVGLLAYGGYRSLAGERALLAARQDLRAAKDLGQDPDSLRVALDRAASRTRLARDSFHDPAVGLLSVIPVLGRPLQSARGLSAAADLAVREALGPLTRAAGPSVAARLLPGGGRVDLAYLASLAVPGAQAAAQLDAAGRELDTAPVHCGIGLLDRARAEFAVQLRSLRSAVRGVALTAQVGPRLLGQDDVRRYLLLVQSPAETRGTGGLLGGYQVVEADKGKLRVVRSGTKAELRAPVPARDVVDLGAEFREHYGSDGPTMGWINFNLSPSMHNAGLTAQALWLAQTGQRVDGVALVDPGAFSYLLEATGPISDVNGQPVMSKNVGQRMMKDVYALYQDNQPKQDRYLQQIAETLANKVLSGGVSGTPLVRALSRAAGDRRLQLWTSDQVAEERLQGLPLGGELPVGRGTGVVVFNASGSKLDFYLDRKVTFHQGCGHGSSRLDVVLTNRAPRQGLPDYVTPAALRGGLPAGTNKLVVTLYAPRDSTVGRLRRDGQEQTFRSGNEDGLRWVEAFATLPAGGSQRFSLEFGEGQDDRAVQLVQQPLARVPDMRVEPC